MIDPEQLLRQPPLQRPSAKLDERIAALAADSRVSGRSSGRRGVTAAAIVACFAMGLCVGFLAGRSTVTPVSDVTPVPPAPPIGTEYIATDVNAATRSVEVHSPTPAHPLPAEPPRITFSEYRPLAALSAASSAVPSAEAPPPFWVSPDHLPVDLATFEYH